jgi:hypothetical protein
MKKHSLKLSPSRFPELRIPLWLFLIATLAISVCGCGGSGDNGAGNPLASSATAVTGTLRGRVTGSGPIANIPVLLVNAESALPAMVSGSIRAGFAETGIASTTTDANGVFTFSEVPIGTYTLVARPGTQECGIVSNVTLAQVNEIQVAFSPTGSVAGSVTVPTGHNLFGLIGFLKGTPFAAYSDNSGKYVISGVPVGTYQLTGFGYGLNVQGGGTITVRAGEITTAGLLSFTAATDPVAPDLIWKGALPDYPTSPAKNWVFFHSGERKAFLYDGTAWSAISQSGQNAQATPGFSWQGVLTSPPANPLKYWAYYNPNEQKSYMYNGATWDILSINAPAGPAGSQGINGASFQWQGSFAAPPANPQVNWGYYNTTDKKSYVWNGTQWQVLAQDAERKDSTPPVIGHVAYEQTALETLALSWATNEDSLTWVDYGPTPALGLVASNGYEYGKSHLAMLQFPTPGPVYYRIRSEDATGNTASYSPTVAPQVYDPAIQMSTFLGGTGYEYARTVLPQADGGFVIAGSSSSNDGDITGNQGGYDFCLMKISAAGSVVWQKSYGGSGNEDLWDAKPTSDGGFILVGSTQSPDGDTATGIRTYFSDTNADGWVVKVDSGGNIQWSTCLGGQYTDTLASVVPSSDGGYFLLGRNEGGWAGTPAPIVGFHGTPGTGQYDLWLLKLDASGNLLWHTNYGGSASEEAKHLFQSANGNLVLVGTTESNDGNVRGRWGQADGWVVSVSPTGTLLWQQCIGGDGTDVLEKGLALADGSLVFVGRTSSTGIISGGNDDVLLVKLNAFGVQEWLRSIGGSDNDSGENILATADGGFVIAATSFIADYSFKSSLYASNGATDLCLFMTDDAGNILRCMNYGGSSSEMDFKGLARTPDNGFALLGTTYSTDGDCAGNTDTNGHFWLFKLKSY